MVAAALPPSFIFPDLVYIKRRSLVEEAGLERGDNEL
jgi:hypothetical protein